MRRTRKALSRKREISNAYLLAKFGFDTAENEPSKKLLFFHFDTSRFQNRNQNLAQRPALKTRHHRTFLEILCHVRESMRFAQRRPDRTCMNPANYGYESASSAESCLVPQFCSPVGGLTGEGKQRPQEGYQMDRTSKEALGRKCQKTQS